MRNFTFSFSRVFILSAVFFFPLFVIAQDVDAPVQKGNIFRSGENVTITEHVFGDLFVLGGTVRVQAPVDGDILAAAGTLVLEDDVGGSVRAVSGTVTVYGSVGRNVTVFSDQLSIEADAIIGESVLARLNTFVHHGLIRGDVSVRTGDGLISGKIEGDATFTLGEHGVLHVTETAYIQQNVEYSGSTPADIHAAARIDGETIFHPLTPLAAWQTLFSPAYLFGRVVRLFGLFIVGLVFVMLLRHPTATIMSTMLRRPWQHLGWGAVYTIITPIFSLLLFGTIIGIPLAVMIIMLWMAALYLAQVFAALTIGFKIVVFIDRKRHLHSLLWPLVLGGIAWTVLVNLPFLGWTFWILSLWWGLGAFMEVCTHIMFEFNRPVTLQKKQS